MRYLDLDHLPDRPLRPQRPISKKKKWIKLGIIIAAITGLGYGGYVLFWPASATIADIFKAPQAVLSFIKPPEQDLKSTNGRTNFLLVGIDRRANEPYTANDCFRTDTMIVASVDLQSTKKDVVLISIPRDTWVNLPGWGSGQNKVYPQGAKINAAYCYGDMGNYPQGRGLGLARDEVQQILDLPIHYALRVDFEGFRKSIDAVGGISINVENDFTDCEYPVEGQEDNPVLSKRYQCVVFKKGYQYMDSEKALQFVRSRHGSGLEGSDLARAKRQQKVMVALRDKALNLQTFSDPLKVSNLIKGLGETLQTLDVDFGQIGQFYKLVQGIDSSSAQNIVLTDDTTQEAGLLTVPDAGLYGGAFVFIPRAGDGNFKEIQAYIHRKLAESTLNQGATSSAQPTSR